MDAATLLSTPIKSGRVVMVWIVQSQGTFTAICPELPRVGARYADPETAYQRCKEEAMKVIVSYQNAKRDVPWQNVNRIPPRDAAVRRFRFATVKQ